MKEKNNELVISVYDEEAMSIEEKILEVFEWYLKENILSIEADNEKILN